MTLNGEKFPSMEDFWEFVKAQGVHTAGVWSRLPTLQKEQIRTISTILVLNLETLADGVNREVEED